MQSLRLNIAALKTERPFKFRRAGRLIDEVTSDPDSLRLSRRQLLGLSVAGAAAIGAAIPSVKAVGATMLGEFEIVGDSRRVAFMLGRKERWAIDTARFGGSPAIDVERRGSVILVNLRNALFPGTSLPADLQCEIRPGLFGRKLAIAMTLGGFKAEVPLEGWLIGSESARAMVAADLGVCRLGSGGTLRLKGCAQAEFSPDWTLRLDGKRIARAEGIGGSVAADTATLWLLAPDDESLLGGRAPKRTLFSLESGRRQWEIRPQIAADGPWSITGGAGAFSRLHIETGEEEGGIMRRAMLAEGEPDAEHLAVQPAGSLRGGDGGTFGLPLRQARYAVSFDPDGDRAALVARYGRRPVWLHTAAGSVLVGDGDGAGYFELHGENGLLKSAECTPALLGTFAPATDPGLISQPVGAERGSLFSFIAGAAGALRDGIAGMLSFDPAAPDDPPRLSLKNLRVSFVRPEDLLVLDIEFINMSVGESRGSRQSISPNGSGSSYIILHFAPQNIAEQAFFETDKKVPVGIPKNSDGSPHEPPDPDQGKSSDDNPTPPPVQSRFSGPSRLVFKVPGGATPIPYSLEAILERCRQYALSVPPSALPPKQPLVLAYIPGLFESGKTINASTFFLLDESKGGGFRSAPSGVSLNKFGGARRTVPADKPGGKPADKGARNPATVQADLIVPDASRVEKAIYDRRNRVRAASSGIGRFVQKNDMTIIPGLEIMSIPPTLRKPLPTETAIEAPFRLILSPHSGSAWAHSPKPVISQRTGRSELWHTRLAVRSEGKPPDENNVALRTVRAVWARANPAYDKGTPASYDQNNPESFNPEIPYGWPKHGNAPFRMSLDGFDRHNIVHLSANFNLNYQRQKYEPLPIGVEKLMLTSLGAWMDVRGAWDKLPTGLAVEEWRHRGTMGRDHYVRVVYAGFLFPFGHRASLIKVTERKFQPHPSNSSMRVAYLRQRMFLVVREPEKIYASSNLTNDAGESYDLMMPFRRVRITTLVTPNLDDPAESDYPNGMLQSAFWPRVAGNDFQFHVVMEDLDGQTSELTMPLQFVGKEIADQSARTTVASIASRYETAGGAEWIARRTRPFNGQKVAMAASAKQGDTTFEAELVTFGAEVPNQTKYGSLPAQFPRFYPVVRSVKLSIPAIKHLVGNTSKPDVKFNSSYLKVGFGGSGSEKNSGEVFLDLLGDPVDLMFSGKGDRSGALMQPNMRISALSRTMGPVAGAVDTIRKGNFDPEEFFGSLGAKLFGVIDLWDIVKAVGVDQGLDLVPKFVTEAMGAVEGFLKDLEVFKATLDAMPGDISSAAATMKGDIDKIISDILSFNPGALPGDLSTFVGHVSGMIASIPTVPGFSPALRNDAMARLKQFQSTLSDIDEFVSMAKSFADAVEMAREMKVKFEWRPKIAAWGFVAGSPLFIPKNERGLYVSVEVRARTEGNGGPVANISCGIDDFALDLIAPASFIKLHFKTLQFFASTGKKPDVNVELDDIEFVGVLSFIETLKDLIPLDGFSDPPALDVSEKGIDATFSVAIPNVAVGVFSLQNISLGAGFTVPFIGDPLSVRFNFCTRENPFNLTVSLFGGGGFFAITLNPSGVQILEVALEFGASVSLDFGVASGGVSVMAGIYFKLANEGGTETCTLTGYFRLHGEVDVLGLISASITLELSLSYEFSSGKCVGRATLTIEVEVLFFSASVEIACERKFAGSKGDPSFEQLMEPYILNGTTVRPWDEYCGAFA